MTGLERIQEYVKYIKERYNSQDPIYKIVLFERQCRTEEDLFHIGINDMGFYYELNTAIKAMNGNWCDIQETCFHAGFVLCHFPGLYESAGPDARIYFEWDEVQKGFFEVDEPEIFKHYAC